jgi:hypothetical protein
LNHSAEKDDDALHDLAAPIASAKVEVASASRILIHSNDTDKAVFVPTAGESWICPRVRWTRPRKSITVTSHGIYSGSQLGRTPSPGELVAARSAIRFLLHQLY